MNITDRLILIFNDIGLKKEDFASRCGISRSQIYKLLSGEQEPGNKFYQQFKAAFPIYDIGWLITGSGEMLCHKPDKSPNGDVAPVSVFNLYGKIGNYIEVIQQFYDHDAVIEISQDLVIIEKESREAFDRARNIIKGIREGVSAISSGDRRKKDTPYNPDRRKQVS